MKATSKYQFTPLHVACSHKAPVEVVRLIVKWYPEALNMKNLLGETPHMLAVNNGASAEVLKALTMSSSGFGVGADTTSTDSTQMSKT